MRKKRVAGRLKDTVAKDDIKPVQPIDTPEKARLCAREASQLKAGDLVILDVRGLSSFADYFLICSGKSSRQVQGIADNLEANLADLGIKPLGIEGRSEGHWVLMDYVDVIIHIFYEPVRHFYDLESLWSDAVRVVEATDAVVCDHEASEGA
jgi:ribosome-associated protein